jgi:Holliday junction resolvase RusA-like endonuclease
MAALTIDVHGLPVPQGSLVPNPSGRGLRYANDASLKAWRQSIIAQVIEARPKGWDPTRPISISTTFRFPRPVNHFSVSRAKRGHLVPAAPEHKTTKPDTDKLIRAVGDSLEQSGLIIGDQQIISINAHKRFVVGDESPGLLLTVISTCH